jgi:hypothetical protein
VAAYGRVLIVNKCSTDLIVQAVTEYDDRLGRVLLLVLATCLGYMDVRVAGIAVADDYRF